MEELIGMLADRLGIEKTVARNVAQIFAQMVKSKLEPSQFAALTAVIPGLAEFGGGDASSGSGGGLLGTLSSGLGDMLGGQVGDALSGFGDLSSAGLEPSKIDDAASVVGEFFNEKAGDDTIANLLQSIKGIGA